MTATTELPRWNLDSILPPIGTDGFDAGFARAMAAARDLTQFFEEQRIGTGAPAPISASRFDEIFGRYLAARSEVRLIEGYLECLTNADTRDAAGQAKLSEFQPTVAAMSVLWTRLTAWVGAADVESLVSESAMAREHSHFLRQSVIRAGHLMSPPEEALAAGLNATGSTAWERLHNNVTSQLMVPIVIDGEERKLPMAEVRNLEEHPDRAVRESAHHTEIEVWRSVEIPLAAALNSVKGEVNLLAQRRGWTSPLEATLLDHAIDRPILEAMMAAAEESFPEFRRYLHIKARRLGLDRLAWWDLYAPVAGGGGEWDYDSACRFIQRHFAGFSPAMGRTAERAFSEAWIDVGPREGKAGGAFCTWARGDESRILCNYQPTYPWMSTLAHELGHAYHNVMRSGRTIVQRRTPSTLAETASIFCETLIDEAAFAEAEPSDRLTIVEAFLQVACAVVVDISSRFYFEREVFERRAARELSPAELCEEMRRAQTRAYGDGLDPETYHAYMWAVKSHYYSGSESFYNYPYMFGLLFGLGLFAAYREDPPAFVPRYEDLLSRTGMATAAELARDFGIDLRSASFWRSGLDMVRERIDRFQTLCLSADF